MSVSAPVKQLWKFLTEGKIGFDQVLNKVGSVHLKKFFELLSRWQARIVSILVGHLLKGSGKIGWVQLVSAANGLCTAEMTVGKEHTNSNGTLHGGLTSTIVDVISGIALSTDRNGGSGVSVNLNVTFLSGVKLGEAIVIEAKTNKSGRTLAYLDVVIKKKSTGALVATGSHIKFIGLN